MAASVYSTIRLDNNLTGILPTKTFEVTAAGRRDRYYSLSTTERSITGRLIVHRTTSAGSPVLKQDYDYEIILALADLDSLFSMRGKKVYFMAHFRDEGDVAYRSIVFLQITSESLNYDPMLAWHHVQIHLTDATGETVD